MSLQLKNISLQRDNETHIYATDLDLVSEQFNTLLGTTLAGKTTLMRLMAGLEKPSSGEVWFEGENITRVPVQKRNVAMVYQQFINYPNFTVYDNIASPMRLLGVDKKTMNDSIERVASLLKLDTMLQRMPNELSGGQQQRTALARALVKNARLVLLDEPLANLDYKLREELRDELPKLFKGSGATVVYATTEPTEALLLGGYTAALLEGRVLQYGITSDVYRRPLNQASAKVFSDPPINTTTVKKQAGQFILDSGASWAAEGEGEALEDGEYLLGIRPHHLTLGESSKASVKIAAEVILTEISGSESTIHAQIDGVATSLSPSTSSSRKNPFGKSPGKAAAAGTWISQSPGVHILEKGQRIDLFLNTRQCLLFDKQDRLVLS